MKTIRVSEIGSYLYCNRSWWYQRQGIESENQAALAGGTAIHHRHGRAVFVGGCIRSLAYAALLMALALGTIAIVTRFLG
jgi:hypothetical protein